MRKSFIPIAIAIATSLTNAAFSQSTSFNTTAGGLQIPIPQPQYPLIFDQPDDQAVPFSSNATFTVTAFNANGYQWLYNGNPIANGTNSILVIKDAGIQDAGYYSCDVYKGFESVPT